MAEVIGRRAIATHLGVNERTVSLYCSRGMPCGRDKGGPSRFDVEQCRAWVAANVAHNQPPATEGSQSPKAAAEIEKIQQEARYKRLKADLLAAELLRREEIEREVARWAVRIRTRLLPLADALASLVAAEDKALHRRTALDEIRRALKEAYETTIADVQIEQMIIDEATRITRTTK